MEDVSDVTQHNRQAPKYPLLSSKVEESKPPFLDLQLAYFRQGAKSLSNFMNNSVWSCISILKLELRLSGIISTIRISNNEIKEILPFSLARHTRAFPRSLFQGSRLPANVFQLLSLKTRRHFSRPLIHLRFGLPFLRVPVG
ncbi:hypothetical protein TNCV_1336611 [Trichonephila clavipes]|nr:hypothetical protein TNCV_1336611 [Trichonephila clavipes]